MVQVESEAIDEIAYDARTSSMFVRFAHGGWYSYFAAPRGVFEDFVAAESHGGTFTCTIAIDSSFAGGDRTT